ncbi:MAG: hypothetical protein ACOCRO_00515 [Halanaerobiales bacterium]
MKFNIEVEVDWLHESSVDDVVKEQIINGISNRIHDDVMEEVEAKASSKLEEIINEKIGEKITETYDQLMEEEIRITNEWGDTKEKGTIKEIIKKRFDKAMTTKVDDRGKPTNYNAVGTRREYLVDKRINKIVDNETKKLTRHIDETIKETMEEKMKDQIGKKLFKALDLDKFVKKEEN